MQKIFSTKPRKIVDEELDNLYIYATGTYKIGQLIGITYDDLVRNFGVPSINEASGDNKVQVEWVFEFDGKPYTIYDWKTFDRDYTLQELDRWSIGGKQANHDFFEALEDVLDRVVLIKTN